MARARDREISARERPVAPVNLGVNHARLERGRLEARQLEGKTIVSPFLRVASSCSGSDRAVGWHLRVPLTHKTSSDRAAAAAEARRPLETARDSSSSTGVLCAERNIFIASARAATAAILVSVLAAASPLPARLMFSGRLARSAPTNKRLCACACTIWLSGVCGRATRRRSQLANAQARPVECVGERDHSPDRKLSRPAKFSALEIALHRKPSSN